MASTITILSGPVRSGKTTWLMHWAAQGGGVCGFLTPDRPGGRVIVDLESGTSHPFETNGDEPHVTVGRYRLRQDAFAWGNKLLVAAAHASAQRVVIDEIGPIELGGHGFRAGFEACRGRSVGETILVVREGLLAQAIATLGLDGPRVLPAGQWSALDFDRS